MERNSRNGQKLAVELADGQQGCVTRAQLRGRGFGDGRVDSWLRNGRLHPLHPGVYLVGHRAEPPRAREMAAVLACGDGAVLSHRSAAHVWWGSADEPRPHPIEVTVVGRKIKSKDEIRIHVTGSLGADEVTKRDDIPITSPARTIVDLAAEATDDELEWALGCAQRRGAATPGHLLTLLSRRPRVRGSASLRRLLGNGPAAFTRSRAERRLLRLLNGASVPKPLANASLAGFEVDLLWPDARLVVEFDSFAFHGDRAAFERDRARDAALAARGYLVIRVTWRQLVGEPKPAAARIATTHALRLQALGNPVQ
jgi:very-short-patch-repair endonuclease